MTGLLLSKKFYRTFGPQVEEIAKRHGLKLNIVHLPDDPKARLSPADCDRVEIAYFSHEWRFTDFFQSFSDAVTTAKNLKWVQFISAAVEQISFVPTLRAHGVKLISAAGINAEPVALNAMTGLLMLSRKFPHYLDGQRRKAWEPLRGEAQPADLRGQTIMVVGIGAIGTIVARLCKAFGMHVIGIRRSPATATDTLDEVHQPARFAELLPRCQWLVLSCPYSRETYHMLNAETLKALPRGAGVINIARGALVDEPALIDSLQSGQIGGAYLDVFEKEPLAAESPLWVMPNVIVTPHAAPFALGNVRRGSERFLINLERWARGESLMYEAKE